MFHFPSLRKYIYVLDDGANISEREKDAILESEYFLRLTIFSAWRGQFE